MRTSPLPAGRPLLWPMRPPESARVSRTTHDGRLEITIEHAPLTGVTPQMLTWWYGHIPGTMEYAGAVYPRYLVWHPLDHISYEVRTPGRDGGVSPGARLRIIEALGRDPDLVIDIQVRVQELTDERAVIVKRLAGTTLVRLENDFTAVPSGTRFVTRLQLGDSTLLGGLFLNRMAATRAFPPAKLQAWIKHHIEEVGNLEHFLPDLFDERADQEP